MSTRRLSDVATATGGRLEGGDREFKRVTQDTRDLADGDLFVAIKGEHFEGHDFLPQAERLGAAGALVQWHVASALSQVVVQDSRKALGSYAAAWRRRFKIPLIGVTGSSGKTTVKEMLASILRVRGETLATRGNLNNDIGLPLTLLALDERHQAAVVEMGTNHPGEIGHLARIAAPTVALVTNAGPAHLEFLGTVADVAREKGAVYGALSEDGVAVINHDDEYAPLWRELAAGRRVVSFGFSSRADFHPAADSLRQSQDGSWQFRLSSPAGQIDLALSLPGRHNVANALAAAAAAMSAGAKLSDTRTGLRQAPATAGRLITTPGWNGSRLIDDSYNANPQSLNAAMEFAVSLGGRSWLALGDMGELGEAAERLHRDAALRARALGIERLFVLGTYSRHAADAFGSGARWFDESGALVRVLQSELTADVTLLVKGSRSMHMERVVEPLKLQPAVERAVNGDH